MQMVCTLTVACVGGKLNFIQLVAAHTQVWTAKTEEVLPQTLVGWSA